MLLHPLIKIFYGHALFASRWYQVVLKNNGKILNSAPEETFTNLKYLRYTVSHLSWKPDYLDKIMQILLKISITEVSKILKKPMDGWKERPKRK